VAYAHSLPDRPESDWEPLAAHLDAVARRAAEFATPFGWAETARLAGQLHDIGKFSAKFQAYIKDSMAGRPVTRVDHSTAGARVAAEIYGVVLGKMLAHIVAGHHAGLADARDIERRLGSGYVIERFDAWPGRACLPEQKVLLPTIRQEPEVERGFGKAFLIRMLFSCLVDADFLETEAFYAGAEGRPAERGGFSDLAALRDRLRSHMARLKAEAGQKNPGRLNDLRSEVLDAAITGAEKQPGFFTLTVPTGGGKTLASLSFALEHALEHRLRRVVYVIPFTSIIEQTAEAFREALDATDDVLEHHANFNWDRLPPSGWADVEDVNALVKLRKAAENWEAPIVVTTSVQFFESLFANRTSRCRKLHNLANSVIVLDEAQTLPIRLLRPCMAAIDELQRNYGASVVLCTATQPALRQEDEFERGLPISQDRELAPDPERLYAELERFKVEWRPEPIGDDVIAARFTEQPQMLCIVNSRAHARALFDAIRGLDGACHLTTLMCPRHRRMVLADLRETLNAGRPVRLVATSLIEAGVDIDFPEVWRAATGLDSIAQAGGRCNREGMLPGGGRVVVFESAEHKPQKDIASFWQAARPALRRHGEQVLGLGGIRDYFRELYWQKGDKALDAALVDGLPGVLPAIADRATDLHFPFASIADGFRMIEDFMEPVVIPWSSGPDDQEVARLLARIGSMDRPPVGDLRKLQQYTVAIPPRARGDWLAKGALAPVHPALGDVLLRFVDLAHYDEATGVRLDRPEYRSAESNIW
jgi:CRISPR-associated endonuclease/helicase Cas3